MDIMKRRPSGGHTEKCGGLKTSARFCTSGLAATRSLSFCIFHNVIPLPFDNCSNIVGTDLSVLFLGTNKFVPTVLIYHFLIGNGNIMLIIILLFCSILYRLDWITVHNASFRPNTKPEEATSTKGRPVSMTYRLIQPSTHRPCPK